MKKTVFLAVSALLLAGSLQARTWTSSDGSKTFEGELKSFDPTTGKVEVIKPDGKPLIFLQTVLSTADREFLASHKPTVEPPSNKLAAASGTANLESTKVGEMASKAKLQKLQGKRFRKGEMTKTPDYYIVYFSASW